MTALIYIRSRIASTDAELVCGNSGDSLTLITDSEWTSGAEKTVTVRCLHPDGSEHSFTVTAVNNYPVLPVIRDTYLAEVSVTQGTLSTAEPARIRFLPCITDGDAAAAQPAPDIYNLMTEYLATQDAAIMEKLTALRENLQTGFPGSAYRLDAAFGPRPAKITGTVTFADGTEQSLTDADMASESLGISARAVPDDFLLPGGVPAAELKLTVYAEPDPERWHQAEISLTYHLQPYRDSVRWHEIPLGTFLVSAAEHDSDRGAAITAYDDMQRFDHVTVAELGFASGTAYTPDEIIALCAEKAGVTWEGSVTGFPNADRSYIMSDADTSMETARDVLMNTVQTVCAFACVDRFRKLLVIPLRKSEPVASIGRSQRKSAKISRLTYRLYELSTSYTLTENGSKVTRMYSDNTLWANGVTAVLQTNPLWSVISAADQRDAVHHCIMNIIDALDPVTYLPAELEGFGDPSLNLMDWLTVQSRQGASAAPLTSYDWKYGGTMTLTACGTEAVAGIARTQAEKAAGSARGQIPEPGDNAMRYNFLMQVRANGHLAMKSHTHQFLAHFTHGELGGETI